MRRIVYGVIVLLLLVPVWVMNSPPIAAQQQEAVAEDLIAALNAWRVEEGLWPFQPNATLEALALDQAEYLVSLPDLPDDIHTGADGSSPKDRARAVDWPTYGSAVQIAAEEIAYAGVDVDAAIRFWQASTVHNRTVTNAIYREIGAAVLPHTYGYLFIVMVGARPNVLPALVDVDAGLVYLSNERFSAAARGDQWVYNADMVWLFDDEGRPLSTNWQAWESTLPLPDDVLDRFFVAYTDGSQQVIAAVSLESDAVMLPTRAEPTPTPTPAPTRTPVPSRTPVPDVSPTESDVSPVPSPAESPSPDSAGELPDFESEDVTESAAPAVRLVYTARTLSVINVSGDTLDISDLVLVGESASLAVSRWDTPWLTAPLTAFPDQDCVQVWSWSESTDPDKPDACRFQRGVITIAPTGLFWAEEVFEVHAGDLVVARCQPDAGECEVTLP